MLLVPTLTMVILALYSLGDGFGRTGGFELNGVIPAGATGTRTIDNLPVVLPEGAIAMPLVLGPFIAFCVMVGLYWSIKSKGTIGSVIGAVGFVVVLVGVLSLCGIPAGRSLSYRYA